MPIVDTKTREQIVARVLTARKNRAEFLFQMKKLQQQGAGIGLTGYLDGGG